MASKNRSPRITFFTKPDCSLCDAAWFIVAKVAGPLGVQVEKVDISAAGAEAWYARYRHDIPVVHIDGVEVCRHHVDEKTLRRLLEERSR